MKSLTLETIEKALQDITDRPNPPEPNVVYFKKGASVYKFSLGQCTERRLMWLGKLGCKLYNP